MNFTEIKPCPIIEAVAEVRFERFQHMPAAALLGYFMNMFQDKFPNINTLPITQLPEEIRIHDNNFRYNPWYQLENTDVGIMVGAEQFAIYTKNTYVGWTSFFAEISNVLDKIMNDNKVVKQVTRLGLKYVDRFDNNIFEESNITLKLGNDLITSDNTVFRTQLNFENELVGVVQLLNNANIQKDNQVQNNVSIVDIDVYSELSENITSDAIKKLFEEAHKHQKELFMKVVGENYLIKNGFEIIKE